MSRNHLYTYVGLLDIDPCGWPLASYCANPNVTRSSRCPALVVHAMQCCFGCLHTLLCYTTVNAALLSDDCVHHFCHIIVCRLYIPYILTASLVFAIACLLPPAQTLAAVTDNPQPHVEYVTATVAVAYAHVSSVWYAYAIILACVYYGIKSKPSVYLMDFTVFESPKDWQVSDHANVRASARWEGAW